MPLNCSGQGIPKFATAVALLWLNPQALAAFFFYMTLVGGLIGLISLAFAQMGEPLKNPPAGSWPARAQDGHNAVPYGIAIATGAVIAFFFMDYFSMQKWGALFAQMNKRPAIV